MFPDSAAAIGTFDGISHLLKVLDLTRQRPLRHALLQLMAALVSPAVLGPAHAGKSPSNPGSPAQVQGQPGSPVLAGGQQNQPNQSQSHSAAPPPPISPQLARVLEANAAALVAAGGAELCVDVVAGAHDATERRQYMGSVPLGHLLTAAGEDAAAPPREWRVVPGGATGNAADGKAAAGSVAGGGAAGAAVEADGAPSAGPMTKADLLSLFNKGQVGFCHRWPCCSIIEGTWHDIQHHVHSCI